MGLTFNIDLSFKFLDTVCMLRRVDNGHSKAGFLSFSMVSISYHTRISVLNAMLMDKIKKNVRSYHTMSKLAYDSPCSIYVYLLTRPNTLSVISSYE